MIYTKGTTTLDGKTYEATKVDYNSYNKVEGQTTLNNKTYYASKIVGLEDDPSNNYRITQVLLDDNTYKYVFEKVETTGSNIYDVDSLPLIDGTQLLQIVGG